MRLMGFSPLVQSLFDGGIETNVKDQATRHTPEAIQNTFFSVRGLIEAEIIHIGPSFTSVVSSFEATKRWKASFDYHYHDSEGLSLLRQLDEAYTSPLLEMDETDFAKICEIRNPLINGTRANAITHDETWNDGDEIPSTSTASYTTWDANRKAAMKSLGGDSPTAHVDDPNYPNEPRRFLASNYTMGLVPPEA
jgi:hypothetical protein